MAEAEWTAATGFGGRLVQRLSGAPLPPSVEFRRVALDDGPFGAFAAHRRLTGDGRVVLVATPGHTPGHASVIAIDDEGRHVLLAGDATDTLEHCTRAAPTRSRATPPRLAARETIGGARHSPPPPASIPRMQGASACVNPGCHRQGGSSRK